MNSKTAVDTAAAPPIALAALTELVAVKDLKDRTEALSFAGPSGPAGENWQVEYEAGRKEYIRRQPAAWEAARAVLAATPVAQPSAEPAKPTFFEIPWKDEPPDWCTPKEEEIWEAGYNCAMSSVRSVLKEPEHCQCAACITGPIHASDCAVHNMPAYPNGPCDCGAASAGAGEPGMKLMEAVASSHELSAVEKRALDRALVSSVKFIDGAGEPTEPSAEPCPDAGHPVLQRLIDSIEVVSGRACWDYMAMYELRDLLRAGAGEQPSENQP